MHRLAAAAYRRRTLSEGRRKSDETTGLVGTNEDLRSRKQGYDVAEHELRMVERHFDDKLRDVN